MLYIMDRLNLYLNNHNNKGINYDIALYIKKNFNTILDMNIVDLADSCHVSQPSITRFCKAMGYESYIHFKDECLLYHVKRKENITKKHVGLTYSTAYLKHDIDAVIYDISSAFHQFTEKMDLHTLDQLADDLQRYQNVYLLGMSYSNLIAEHLQMELSYLGKEIQIISDSSNTHIIEDFEEDNLLIIISLYQNFFDQDFKLHTYIEKSKCKKWLITAAAKHDDSLFKNVISVYDSGDLFVNRYVLLFLIDFLISRYEQIAF